MQLDRDSYLPPTAIRSGPFRLSFERTLLMGVVNLTPDSFSDGGRFEEPEAAVEHARRLVARGADIVDLGAESSRPGARAVDPVEELDRLLPVLEGLSGIGVPISVDTRKPEVARAALAAGAHIVNDIQGGSDEMLEVAASFRAPLVAMHMQGMPETMQRSPHYDDVVGEVTQFLRSRQLAAARRGVQVILDPGIGFGKTFEHNLELLRRLGRIVALGSPVLVGTSRKSFLGRLSGRPVGSRVEESVVSGLVARAHGAHILRVHDVEAHRAALDVTTALEVSEVALSVGTQKVFARSLSCESRIGISLEERSRPQPLQIDLEVSLDTSGEDSIERTVDYVALFDLARQVSGDGERKLLETLARDIANRIFERWAVDEVSVEITKPAVSEALGGGDFGIVLRRSQSEVQDRKPGHGRRVGAE